MIGATPRLARRAAPWLPGSGWRTVRPALLLAAAVMVPQCRTARDPASGAATPPGDDRSITMERAPCYGTCPVYTVTVGGDGEVRFRGTANVAQAGERVARIPRARVDSLFRYVDSIAFDRLDASYTYGTNVCGAYVTDLPAVVVSVMRSGVTRRVRHDYGCEAAPGALRELHRRIDETAGTQQWIGGR
jgi:hypothetical protein